MEMPTLPTPTNVTRQILTPEKKVALRTFSGQKFPGYNSENSYATIPAVTETPMEAALRAELEFQQQLDIYDREVAGQLRGQVMGYLDDYREEFDEVKAEQKQRLANMDRGVSEYDAMYNEGWMTQTLARESAAWDMKTSQVIQNAAAEYAALGRTPSPAVMGELRRTMAVQKADSVQKLRMTLEQERANHKLSALQLQNDVNKNIQVQAADMSGMYALLANL